MIIEALVIAGASSFGAYHLYSEMPPKVQKLLIKYPLMTDVLMEVLVWVAMGGTLTATGIMAAAFTGLLVDTMIRVANNEEGYQWLGTLLQQGRSAVSQAVEGLKSVVKETQASSRP